MKQNRNIIQDSTGKNIFYFDISLQLISFKMTNNSTGLSFKNK